jgi:HEPN domain-containing protein
MNDEKRAYIRNWLKKARHDFINAKTILEVLPDGKETPFDTVCFHCQQAVEKYLKACLVHFDADIPRTHDLADLTRMCAQFNQAFLEISDLAETLTPYAAGIRYPDDFYLPSLEEAREALQTVVRIKEFLISQKIPGFEEA